MKSRREFRTGKAEGSLSLTSKLGDREGILGEETSIKDMIEKDPLRLWNLIHAPESKISLIQSTYIKLKEIVKKIAPDLVKENNKVFKKHKTLRKAAMEKHLGIFGTEKSSFKSLGKSSGNPS